MNVALKQQSECGADQKRDVEMEDDSGVPGTQLSEAGQEWKEFPYVHPPAEDQTAERARQSACGYRSAPTELLLAGAATIDSAKPQRHTHGHSQTKKTGDQFRKVLACVPQHDRGAIHT